MNYRFLQTASAVGVILFAACNSQPPPAESTSAGEREASRGAVSPKPSNTASPTTTNGPTGVATSPDASEQDLHATTGTVKPGLGTLIPMARSGVSQYSPDGKWFAIGADDVRLFDVASRSCVRQIAIGKYPLVALDFSDDSNLLAVGMWMFEQQDKPDQRGLEIVVVSIPDGKEISRFTGLPEHSNWRRRLAISPDGGLLADGNSQGIAVYNIETGETTWEVKRADLAITGSSYASFDVTPDWKYFLFNMQRINYPSKETIPMVPYDDTQRPFFWVNLISPDGKRAAALGGPNGSVQKLFDLESGKLLQQVTDVPSRSFVATPGFQRFVNAHGIWSAATGEQIKLREHGHVFEDWYSVRSDGKEATAGAEYFALNGQSPSPASTGQLRRWGTTTFLSKPLTVEFDEHGLLLVQCAGSGRRVNLETGELGELESFPRRHSPGNPPTSFGTFPRAASPSGQWKMDKVGWLVHTKNGSKKYVFEALEAKQRPKQGQPYFASEDRGIFLGAKNLFLVDVKQGSVARTIPFVRKDETATIESTDDGRVVAISQGSFRISHRRHVSVVNVEDGNVVLPSKLLAQCQLALHPRGSHLACFGHKWLKLYDCGNGELAHEVKIQTGNALSATFHPGEPLLCVVTDNATVEVIHLKSGQIVAVVAARGKSKSCQNMALIRGKDVMLIGDANQLFSKQ